MVVPAMRDDLGKPVSRRRLRVRPELHRYIRLARRQGWTVTRTGHNHLRFRSPTGELVHTGMTPSDRRSVYNTAAELRRAGLDLEPR